MPAKAKATMRKDILRTLRKQGYVLRDGRVELPEGATKDDLRSVNEMACQKKRDEARPRLAKREDQLLAYIASGCEIVPEEVSPQLVLVRPDTEDELLFRYIETFYNPQRRHETLNYLSPISSKPVINQSKISR